MNESACQLDALSACIATAVCMVGCGGSGVVVLVVIVVLWWCLYVVGGGVCLAKFYFMGFPVTLALPTSAIPRKKNHPDLSLTLCYTE